MGAGRPRTSRGVGVMTTTGLELAVHAAIASIDDPEYPGVAITDLGLLESLEVSSTGVAEVGLIPTFSGCPALAMIAVDVETTVAAVDGVTSVNVTWLSTPVWTIDRVSVDARRFLADEFTVAVQIGRTTPTCPRCGAPTQEQSAFGPSRCRSVHRCSSCNETVEVMRG